MNELTVEQKIIQILVDNNIVSFNFDPPYIFTTGLASPIYIDNRLLISHPKERAFIVNEMVKLIKNKINLDEIDYISSSLSFAAPFGVLVAEALNLPLILIRDRHTEFGKRNKIEGHLPKGSRVLIIEDHISTGAAVVDNIATVREAGGKAKYCVAITDYEIDLAKKSIEEHNITTLVLARCLPIVEEAEKRGKLTKEEKENIYEWFKDPVKWGKVRGYYND